MLGFLDFERASAQQTNPVDRQVQNPITDTPNVNPVASDIKAAPTPRKTPAESVGGDGDVVVDSNKQSVEGPENKRVVIHDGNVDVRYGIYRLQADRIVIFEEENMIVATGNVVFDQGDDQRITGTRGEWNYKTKLGWFVNSTGFTNQTNDGTVIYFTAERVERVSLDEIVVIKGKFTACEDAVPKWSFTADEARVKTNDRIKLKNPKFRVSDVPIAALPYVSISIKKRDRASGFLTPTFGYSGNKGLRLSSAYYKTLGQSADVTLRADVYSMRGLGFGFDLRTRANSRSYFNMGLYGVRDRLFSTKRSPTTPDQGGTTFYADGVHYFPNGFIAAADVRIYSNLAFRQVFSEGIQQVISPIENSQVFVNKNWDDYSLNFLARTQTISVPNARISTRNQPSVFFEKRPSPIKWLRDLPVYFSFKTALEGVSRRESVDSLAAYQAATGGSSPIVSPALGQRLDFFPQVTVPFSTKYVNFTATAGLRSTYYSNSLDQLRRVIGRDYVRTYGEFEFDVKPVSLARNFYRPSGGLRFRHVIEPYLTYRYVKGVSDFGRAIRFDFQDTYTDTNEIEVGLVNRFYTRRYTEAVTPEAQRTLSEASEAEKSKLSVQPYEIFSFTIRAKHFIDPYFGGALVPGQRNQIAPISRLTFYSFGGVPRRWSPINFDLTYRPRKTIFASTRLDVGTQGEGLRNIATTLGYDTKLVKIFQTFYYTRAVTLIPSLRRFSNPFGKEPGTLRGSQWNPSVFLGNREKGWFFGTSLFFDFQNKRASKNSPLISSVGTIGYAYDCCSVILQAYTYDIGVRRENRLVFSFRLNGIGAFGTEQIGQGVR